MIDLLEIINAWKKAANPTEEDLRIANDRLNRCAQCPNLKKLADVKFCGLCLCPISKKIFSGKNSCPESKW